MPRTNAADTMIVAEGLAKTFVRRRALGEFVLHPFRPAEKVVALDRVDLEVRRGEVFGLLGPNGAGKTTLLKILCCLVLPDAGRALVHGHDTAREEIAVRRRIGYVASDERSFYWRLTGAQNLTFFARLFHVPPGQIAGRVRALLERMELTEKAHLPFSGYSSGMKQRLAIARALLHEPPILYLDEPTRSLDPVTARHIREVVRRDLADRDGKTILLATHNLQEAADLCDRMAILARARVHRVGRLDEFRALIAAGRGFRVLADRPVELAPPARPSAPPEDEPPPPAGQVATFFEVDPGAGNDLAPLFAHLAGSGARIFEISRVETSLDNLFHRLFSEAAAAGPGESRP